MLISDDSDNLTVRGGDMDDSVTEEELGLVKEAVRFEEQLVGYAVDYKIQYRVKERLPRDRALQAIKHLSSKGEITPAPFGSGAWRLAK